jgi:D-apiose dehydrogenase
MDEMRFAIFGTGFWSRFQLAAWQELKGVKCVALYNRSVSKAEKLAHEFGIPAVYGDPEELLCREKLDFVDIISDPWTHSKFVHMVAAHKLPVICQKPMAPTLAEAGKMVKACCEAGAPYLIHENWRWQTPIRELKKVLDSGAIGTPFRARLTCVSGYPVFVNEPWLKGWPEYIILDMGSHLLDVARFLFGEAESLFCQFDRIHADIKGEDVATVMMRMGKGTTVTVELGFAENYLEHDALCETPIFVEGDQGSAELDHHNCLRVTTKSGTLARRCPPRSYSWALPEFLVCHASIVACNHHLLKALRGESPAETRGDDNLKTMELVFAAYDSARSGKALHFTEDGKGRAAA